MRSRIASLRFGAMLSKPKYCKAPINPWFFLGIPLRLTWHSNSGLRYKMFLGNVQPAVRWQGPAAANTKLMSKASGPGWYGGWSSWSRHSRMVCPVSKSWNTPQTTSGRSPGTDMNSKSSRMTRAKGRLLPVTTGPLLHQNMIGAVDQPAFVLEREPDDLGGPDIRPIRVAVSAVGCGEVLVGVVRLVGVHPEPAVHGFDQCHFLCPVPLVLLALCIRAADGNDPQAAFRSDGQIERVIGDRDAHAGQRLDHVGHHGDEVMIHADLDVHERHDRPERLV